MYVRTSLHVHSVINKQTCNNDVMTSSTTFTSCIPEDTWVEEVELINHVVADLRKRACMMSICHKHTGMQSRLHDEFKDVYLRKRVQHQKNEWLQPKHKCKTWHSVFHVKYFVSLNRYRFYNPKGRYEWVSFRVIVWTTPSHSLVEIPAFLFASTLPYHP